MRHPQPFKGYLLASISVVWVGVLLILTRYAGNRVFDPDDLISVVFDPGGPIAVIVTGTLVCLNVMASLAVLRFEGRIPHILNLPLVALFCFVHYQFYRHCGAEHYTFDTVPAFLDWVIFSVAHILHVADLPDCFAEYGIDLQSIHARSIGARVFVVFMNWVVGFFVVASFVRLMISNGPIHGKHTAADGFDADEKRPNRVAGRLQRVRLFALVISGRLQRIRRFALVFCCLLIVMTMYVQEWRWQDWLRWPLDNFLRIVDLGDTFQVFHYRLHDAPIGFWNSTLAFSFRLCLLAWSDKLITHVHLVWFTGKAMPVERLAEFLHHRKSTYRRAALVGLTRYGPAAEAAVPALVDSLGDNDARIRRATVEALGAIGSNAEAAVPALVECLDDSDTNVRRAAAEALGNIGPKAEPAVSSLVECLDDNDTNVRRAAAEALGNIGLKAESAIPVLEKALDDEDESVCCAIAMALWYIAGKASLRSALDDKGVRCAMAVVVWNIAGKPASTTTLDDGVASVRCEAAAALKWMGAKAESAVPSLVECLDDEDTSVCCAVAAALVSIAGETAFKNILEHKSLHCVIAVALGESWMTAAVDTLKAIAQRYRDCRPAVEALAELKARSASSRELNRYVDEDWYLCRKAAELVREGEAKPRDFERSREKEKQLRVYLRRRAAEMICEKIHAKGAANPRNLRKFLEHEDLHVRYEAIKVLAKAFGMSSAEVSDAISCLSNKSARFVRDKLNRDPEIRARSASDWELQRYLGDDDVYLRRKAAEMMCERLHAKGDATPRSLRKALEHSDKHVCYEAIKALAKAFGMSSAEVSDAISCLSSSCARFVIDKLKCDPDFGLDEASR